MSRVFAIPYQYINDIGIYESAMLLYLIKKVCEFDGLFGKYLINKRGIREDYMSKFIPEKEIDRTILKLYDFGFLFFNIKSGKRTRTISISVFNIILYELSGKEQYLSSLSEYNDNRIQGKIITYDALCSMKLSIPDFISMTSKNFYINYEDGIDSITKQLKSLYFINMDKIEKDDLVGEIAINDIYDENNKSIRQTMLLSNGFVKICDKPLYREFFDKGKIFVLKHGSDDCSENSNSNSNRNITLKDEARNNYSKFCEYLKIGQTMRKPICEWNARDFVSYIYCGLAKMNEDSGDFIFPDFSRDCARMKRLMDKYGNKRLNRIIFLMVKNTDDMVSFCGFKNFKPSPSILSVDWIFDKMISYSNYVDNKNSYKALEESIANKENEDIGNNNLDEDLKKDNCDVKLMELRKVFNKDKETK